jgi:hypothetical protein
VNTKEAQFSRIVSALKPLVRPSVGAAFGGGLGYYVTPEVFGYADVPEARRVSSISDAVVGALLGAAANRSGFRAGAQAFKALPLKQQLAIGGGVVGAPEIGPQLMAVSRRQQSSDAAQTEAAKSIADSADSVSIPNAIKRVVQSGTARGAAAGASTAGIAAILTGLLRAKSQHEVGAGTNRTQMMQKDFLKYLLPALVAGGVIGSFRGAPGAAQ